MTQEEFFAVVSVVCLAGCAALVVVGWFNGHASRRAMKDVEKASAQMRVDAQEYVDKKVLVDRVLNEVIHVEGQIRENAVFIDERTQRITKILQAGQELKEGLEGTEASILQGLEDVRREARELKEDRRTFEDCVTEAQEEIVAQVDRFEALQEGVARPPKVQS